MGFAGQRDREVAEFTDNEGYEPTYDFHFAMVANTEVGFDRR